MSDDRAPGSARNSDDDLGPESPRYAEPEAQRDAVENAPDDTIAHDPAPKVPTAEPPLLDRDAPTDAGDDAVARPVPTTVIDHPVTSPTETIAAPPGATDAPTTEQRSADEQPADNRYAGWYNTPEASAADSADGARTDRDRTDRDRADHSPTTGYGAAAAPVAAATAASAAAPAAATPASAPAPTPAPAAQQSGPVHVPAPTPPRRKSNRAVGILIAFVSSLVFALLFALGAALLASITNPAPFDELLVRYVGQPVFWIPVLIFFLAFALLVALANRANWWAYVLGGFPVALIVYAAYIGARLIQQDFTQLTPSEAALVVQRVSTFPDGILAAVLAREIVIWAGAAISGRGRSVKARNAEARAAYDRSVAGDSADRSGAGAPAA